MSPAFSFSRVLHCILAIVSASAFGAGAEKFDVVVYGGTSGGVIAAVQAARLGKSVVLVEPTKHLGGLTSGGLGWVDVGNPMTIGGLSREYFHKVWEYYQDDANWHWEKKRKMTGQHAPLPASEHTMWTLEPSVAEKLFDQMIAEAKVTLWRNERLDRKAGVMKQGQRITSIGMESGRTIEGKMFIDSTYEGDLMAAAGVSYIVGREGNARYSETINGVRPLPMKGRFPESIDPYVVKGDPKSGLLPRVYADWGGKIGDEDRGVQAYNYRLCMTKHPENRVPFEKPKDYDEKQYVLLFRWIEAGGTKDFCKLDPIANLKTDTNNYGYISTDYVGMSWDYPEADYATRARIAAAHEQYMRGFFWTLQNHPRIPEATRKQYAPWGLAKDEFTDSDHWPHQLYIREARRMKGDTVVTENTALRKEPAAQDPVGLGSYHMDSHAIKLFVQPSGFLSSEGGMFVQIPGPFGIPYRSIVPKKGECENLLVPVCVSSTHAAYGTIRMEPVFMVLGQSAATAASLAIDRNVSVQELPYAALKEQLVKDKQLIR